MTTNIIPISQTNPILLWTLCCMLFLSTTGHTQTTVDTIPASQYFAKADTLLTHRKLDSAIVYFKKALPIYRKAKSWERVARCYNKISESQWKDKKYKESLGNAKQALAISDQYLPENNREEAYGYDNIAQYYYSKRLNYKKALLFYQKGLKIKLMVFSENHLFVAGSYLNIGNALLMKRKYDEALEYYKKSIVIREDKLEVDHIDTGLSYFNLGLTYDRKEEYNKALPYLKKALSIRIKRLGEKHKDVAICYHVIGWIYKKKGEYDKGLFYLEKNLSTLMKIDVKDYYNISRALNVLGVFYKNKGMYNEALKYFDQSIVAEKKILNYKKNSSKWYNNIGIVYMYKGEYNKALKYLKKALQNNVVHRGENDIHVALNYNNIANVYRLKKDYNQSLKYYNKALRIRTKILDPHHSDIAESHNDMGKLFIVKKEYNKAFYYVSSALKIRQNVFGEHHPDVADSYISLGNIYESKKEYKFALTNYQKALRIRRKVFGAYHPKVAVSNNDIANLYALQKEYKNSLLYYEKAIIANVKEDQYLNPNILLTSLAGRTKTYLNLYKEHKNIDDLNQAIIAYKKADALINDIRQTFTTYQDKVAFAQKAKAIYQGAIQTQLLRYTTQKEQSILERAFYYAEKSKANTLKELLSEANAKNFTGLPNDMLVLEKELRIDKAFYQSKITDVRSETTVDSSKITIYENKLFEINRRQDSLTAILEKNYPKYYQLKHENTIVSVADIQKKLNERTTLVEFFTADSSAYIFTVSKYKMAVQEVSTPDLTGQIEQLREAITSQELSRYKTIAHELYTTLIHPIKDQFIGDDELIIVPDGPLWHCNFELLLTQKDGSNNPAALSYLLKDYAITYANAANLLFAKSRSEEPIEKRQECLAFSFSEGDQVTSTNTMSMATLRDAGGDLPGTREEIKAISDIIDGQYYFGSQAIETNFKKNAGQYNILHLALHGDVDNERPENSKLYFTKSKDTIEDNLLYSHELFALDIPAELTVLSACNTGTGKIAKGEGIMSLGSAFQYAGTKSLLLTRWEVSDQTTPQVMKYFYTNLKQGMNKAKALQQAKLQYLATADINRTQPFYWGAFYLVGDAAPMHFESTSLWYWILGLGCVGMLLWIGFWYKRRRI
ncbi:tetratricopeptide repeat protein [Aquimarina sp. AU119]|uniref:CHAT domain-containing protein n=1 Tax=Aquimarina sp. AU119 TaxID=2108528 RepID=UPI000D6893F5|nr:tetratricopeptide repeat protein [Aquimarina sp. AU119]